MDVEAPEEIVMARSNVRMMYRYYSYHRIDGVLISIQYHKLLRNHPLNILISQDWHDLRSTAVIAEYSLDQVCEIC